MSAYRYAELQSENARLRGENEACKKDLEDEAVRHFREKRRMDQEMKELKAERDQLKFDNTSLRKRIEESKQTTVRFSKDQEQHEKDQEEIMRLRKVQSELLSRLDICETNLDLIVPEIYDLVDKVDVAHNATTRIKSGFDVMTSTLRRSS
ncbi:hypothetical protein BKA81DRAFT_382412 [Phyllosticta paracitricarpa]